MPRQFSIKKPVADRFLKYVDDNKGTRTREAFAWACVRQGIEEIQKKEISDKLGPLVNAAFGTTNEKIDYQEDENPDAMADRLPARLGIKNKKIMLIEGCFRFMISNGMMKSDAKRVLIID